MRISSHMLRLRDDQWERIREHFPKEYIQDNRPGRKPVPTCEVRRDILTQLANTLREEGADDERENFADATFAAAKGVKILAIVERHGLPLSVRTQATNHHEVTLVQLSFNFYMLEAKSEHLIGSIVKKKVRGPSCVSGSERSDLLNTCVGGWSCVAQGAGNTPHLDLLSGEQLPRIC
jgi:hypothetical protein